MGLIPVLLRKYNKWMYESVLVCYNENVYFVRRENIGQIMEKIAERLVNKLLRENLISESMVEVYQYGIVRLLEIGAAVVTGAVICLGMGMLWEGVIFFLFFVPLRSYLGGFHMEKYWQCYIMSCLTLVAVLTITKFVLLDVRVSVGLIVAASVGIGLEAAWELKKGGNRVYAFVIWVVLILLLAVMGFCAAKGLASLLVLLCCVTVIVLVSKAVAKG